MMDEERDTPMMEEEEHDTEHREDSMFMTKREVVSTRQQIFKLTHKIFASFPLSCDGQCWFKKWHKLWPILSLIPRVKSHVMDRVTPSFIVRRHLAEATHWKLIPHKFFIFLWLLILNLDVIMGARLIRILPQFTTGIEVSSQQISPYVKYTKQFESGDSVSWWFFFIQQ